MTGGKVDKDGRSGIQLGTGLPSESSLSRVGEEVPRIWIDLDRGAKLEASKRWRKPLQF